MKPTSIVLDTDIGDDIDDALALTVALNSPEIDLRGVTTVFRDAPRRSLLVKQLLQLFNREVPVRPGVSKPLLKPYSDIAGGGNVGKQFEALDPALKYEKGQHAVDFLIEQSAATERLTIVAIGPLTNIALTLVKEPEVIERSRLVLMGGQWSRPGGEWNIICDPEAAAIVFNSGIEITMVGLDVTLQCVLSDAQVEQFLAAGTAPTKLLYDLTKLWQHKVTLHDPLTMLTVFSDCVQFEEKRIEVVLSGDERGRTKVVEGVPNCRVAVSVDVERAVNLFMERALKGS